MKVQKILCCCGSGLGSSLIVHMNTEEAVKNLGYPDIQVDHTTISDITPTAADLFVIGNDLKDFISEIPDERKVIIMNILDKDELQAKLAEVLEALKDK